MKPINLRLKFIMWSYDGICYCRNIDVKLDSKVMLRSDTSAVWKKTKDLSCILFGHWLCFLHPWWLDVVHCLGLQVLNTAANDWKPPLPYKDKHCFLMCSKGQRLQRRFRFHSGKKYSLQNYLIYGPRLKHQRFHQNRKTKLKNCVTISPLMRLLFFGIMRNC